MSKVTVKSISGITNENWLRHFAPGNELEVIRETKIHKFIPSPLKGCELKIVKSTGRLTDFKPGTGVQFELE